MTVLVTGGCGFVGLNLAEALTARGRAAVLFDRRGLPGGAPPARPGHLAVVEGDARDRTLLERVMREFRVERVIHAAVITSGAGREAAAPDEIAAINLGGTLSVLGAARAAGCRRVLYVGSGAAYGATLDEDGPLREDAAPSRPETLYGVTKFAAERAALRLRELWGLDIVCARLGTVFGPWEYGTGARDRMSPQLQLARLAVRGAAAVLPEREVRRDWVYSRDVAAGLVALVFAAATPHGLYHLSSGRDWAGFFPRWCETLRAAYPGFSWRHARAGERPNVDYHAERDRATMDVGRIAADAGFVSRYGPGEACADFIAWLRGHAEFAGSGVAD